jgi:hypothetical protein
MDAPGQLEVGVPERLPVRSLGDAQEQEVVPLSQLPCLVLDQLDEVGVVLLPVRHGRPSTAEW